MIRVMLNAKTRVHSWWVEAANTTIHIINKVYPRPMTDKMAYEIWKGKKSKLSYLHFFGRRCYILKDIEQIGNSDARSDKGFFLGYYINGHAFRVFNKRTAMVMESVNVTAKDVE